MKRLFLALLATATALAIAPSAMATPVVSGSIGVAGFSDSWTSTLITFTGPGLSGGGTGTLGSDNGGLTALTSFTFTSSNGVELFDIAGTVDAPVTFTINGPVDVVTDTNSILNITGNGTIAENGYTSTTGTFILTSSNSGTTSFEVTANSAATPEPSSLLLLGTGLLGLAFVAFRKAKASGVALNMSAV